MPVSVYVFPFSTANVSVTIGGAHIAYGVWFYLVAGIAVLSLVVAVGIYFLGRATSARAAQR